MKTGQVFISHTSDMAVFPRRRSFVQAALDAVARAGMAPVDMRYFAARDGKPADYCRQRVGNCEVYVAVVGFRYGSIVPGETVSYTELEFNTATAAGLPRLVFLLGEPADLPTDLADAEPGAVDGFRQRLCEAGLIVRTFTSDADLELEVFHGLITLPGATHEDRTGGSQAGRSGESRESGTFTHIGQPSQSTPLAVRYSLPPDTTAFTGRDEELDLIADAVIGSEQTGGVVAIPVIGGMPGVGKTALAVHIAHQMRDRFPDRQLFIDLHAHTPGQAPMSPKVALAGLLAAVGVDTRYLPEEMDGRMDLWRDRMADQRALVVLDNAASSEHVAPLLPGSDNCLVMVTSRRHLSDLPGAVPISLDALPPDRAQAMFLRLAPRALTAPAPSVRELVRLAGYLPLAISLLARLYARHPSWTLNDLTRETRASLLNLSAEKDSIAAVFEVSYRYLAPGTQQFFRCLSLHPGITIDAYAAAALAGIPLRDSDSYLDILHGEGLLIEVGYRRYGMHDLIRSYARDRGAADPAADRDQALARLLDYYQHTAAITEDRLTRNGNTPTSTALPSRPTAVPDLPDGERALSWARAERANLQACLDHATRSGQHSRVVALTAAIATVLRQDGPWADAITRHATSARAAHNLGDRLSEAHALNNLGIVRRLTGAYPGAADALNAALDIYRDTGERIGQANTLTELGVVQRVTGDYPGAADALNAALDIYRDTGDRIGQADALNYLGAIRMLTEEYPRAAAILEEALGIYRDTADRLGQANALNHLAVLLRRTGNYMDAAAIGEEALDIYRDIGDRLGEAEALNEIATLQRVLGHLGPARAGHQQALSLARNIASSWNEAHALAGLGRCALAVGNTTEAEASLRQAQEIFQRIGAAEAPDVAAELRQL
jgi:tetratricopeptide (TPR) repeat protein